jgi:acyl-CoA thioester hydrolase
MVNAEISVRIPFFDVDSLSIVWHGHYLKYMEEARSKLFECLGYNYYSMTTSGYIWPVVKVAIKYIKPCKLLQNIKVKAILQEYEHRIRIKYVMTDEDGGVVLKAETVQMGVDAATGETCFMAPKFFIDKVESYINESSS